MKEILFLLALSVSGKSKSNHNAGKLKLNVTLEKLIQDQQNINQFQLLPISLNHIYFLENLPQHHKDPFDRLLISQSIIEQIPILSIDKIFDWYSVQRIW